MNHVKSPSTGLPMAFGQERTIVSREVSVPGVLVQQIHYRCAQSISRLYEVGAKEVVLIAGRTHGESVLSQVTAPRQAAGSFYRSFESARERKNSLKCIPVSEGVEDCPSIILEDCVLNGLGSTTIARDLLCTSSASLLFLQLLPVTKASPSVVVSPRGGCH